MNRYRAAVFLDRDGTLNVERSYITRPEQMQLLPGVGMALCQLAEAGFLRVVVTNQSAIGRGMMTETDLHSVHEEMCRQLAEENTGVDAIYHCSAVPAADSPAIDHPERKPAPGMLLRAARELHIELPNSWMIGDSLRDLLAGQRAGCRGCILVRTGHPIDESAMPSVGNFHIANDLAAAVQIIFQESRQSARVA